jgi:hypothetical protein
VSRAFLWFFLLFAAFQVIVRTASGNRAMPPMVLWCAVGAFCAARLFARSRRAAPPGP